MYRPGGDSDDNSDYELDGFSFGSSVAPPAKRFYEVDPYELFIESLVKHIQTGNLEEFKVELGNWKLRFDINEDRNDWNLLFHACFNAQLEIVQYLVDEKSAKVNIQINSNTPLMIACSSDDDHEQVYKVVDFLINRESILNVSNTYGMTPLMFAVQKGHLKVVKLFIAMDVSLESLDNYGSDALLMAVEHEELEIAKILINAGCDYNIVNRNGLTAKKLAEINRNQEILDLLPKDEVSYEAPQYFINYQSILDLVPKLSDNNIPPYFPDVAKMLQGMRCEDLINLFAENRVSFEDFLIASDQKLEEIGVKYPFKRSLILVGLKTFHEKKWLNKSMGIFKPEQKMDLVDFYYIFATLLKQLVIMKSGLIYVLNLKKMFNASFESKKLENIKSSLKKIKDLVVKIEREMAKIEAKNPKKRPGTFEFSKQQLVYEFSTKSWRLQKILKISCMLAVPVALVCCFKLKI